MMLTAGWRMRWRRASTALLLFDLLVHLFLHEEVDAASSTRGPCRARHPTRNFELTDGRCMPVHECLESLRGVGRLKFPIFCGVEILLPIVCCPLRARRRGTTAPPGEQVQDEPGSRNRRKTTGKPQRALSTLPPALPTPDRSEAVVGEPQEEPHSSAQGSQPAVPVVFSGSADEPSAECETPNGQQGACLPLESCMPLREQVRRKEFPPLCDLRGTTPYACCPARLFRQGSQHIGAVETTPAPPEDDMSSVALNRAIRMTQIVLENNRYCGKTPESSMQPGRYTPTVFGGRSVSLGKYAFAVAIFREEVKILNYWCGGTLITSRVVLSAAHCFVYSLNGTKYIARVGGVNISDVSNATFVQRNVASVHLHPEYNDRRHYNDVALLLLDLPARQRGVEQPFACLPDANSAATMHGIATVLGWGHNAFGGTLQTVLQEAQVPLVHNAACDRAYRSLGSYDREFPHGVNEHFVCAGNITDGGVDACQLQDSGGPLVVNVDRGGETYYELVGVVSFGVGCGSAAFPGVYASVSHFMPWILNATAGIVPEEAYDRINFV